MTKKEPQPEKSSRQQPAPASQPQVETEAPLGSIGPLVAPSPLSAQPNSITSQAAMLKRLPPAQQQSAVQRMHQTQGNRHVQRVVSRMATAPRPAAPTLQAKLTVNEPDDAFEQEADAVADSVMRAPAAATPPPPPDEQLTAGRSVQAKGDVGGPVSDGTQEQIARMQSGGQPLPDSERAFFEERMGADFSGVRVHPDGEAADTAQDLSARAFTVGNHIAFNEGEYQPGTSEGRHLLAHELTHTVQQGAAETVATKRIQRKEERDAEEGEEPTPEEKAAALAAAQAAEAIATQAHSTGETQAGQSRNEATTKQEETGQVMAVATQTSQEANAKVQEGEAKKQALAAEKPMDGAGAKPPAEAEPKAAAAAPQPAAKGAGDGAGERENTADKAPASAEADPGFQGMKEKSQSAAKQESAHDPAEKKAGEAQAAAQQPASEVSGHAQNTQVGKMEQAEAPPFDAPAFKARLMERIAALAPRSVEEADEFKEQDKLGGLKEEMKGEVTQEQDKTQAPMEQAAESSPDTASVEKKPVTPLQAAAPGEAVSDVGAKQAVPKEKGKSEVETPIEDDSKALDQKMQDNEITEEQLADANEPTFSTALESKKGAQEHAKSAPPEYRQAEQEQLTQAEAEATAVATEKMQGMHGDRTSLFGQVDAQQQSAKTSDEQARDKVGTDIQAIYDKTKTQVDTILGKLDGEVTRLFDEGAQQAKKVFEEFVDAKMEAYKEERYGGWLGWARWAKDKLFDMPDEVNVFYTEGRQLYISKMDGVIDTVVGTIGKGITEAKAEIARGKKEIQEYVNRLPDDLKEVGQQASQDIQGKFDQLEQDVNAKQDDLVNTLAQKYTENLQAVDARIEELKAANKGLVGQALDAIGGVIKTILELKEMLLSVLEKAASAVMKILKDPIGFLGNLITGVKQGLMNFVSNIGTHLQTGLTTWLFGEVGKAGIQMPENLDFEGVLGLATQMLGMTWDFIRARASKILGEEVVSKLETGFEWFMILKEQGLAGLWQYLQDQLGMLKDMVIDGIKDMVIGEVVEAGIQWLVGILGGPAGAFIKAAKAIYDIIMWFVNNGSQVMTLVSSILDSITAIADGSLDAAATYIEESLAKALPVVIGFLASLLGLGDLGSKIRKIIERVQEPIGKAIDWVIEKAKGFVKKVGKALGFGKDDEDEQGKDKDKEGGDKDGDGEVGESVSFNADGEGHRLWVSVEGTKTTIMVASTPGPVENKLGEWKRRLNPSDPQTIAPDNADEARTRIEAAETLHTTIDEKSDLAAKAKERAKNDPAAVAEFERLDQEVETSQQDLADHLKKLFTLYGEDQKIYKRAILGAASATAYYLTATGWTSSNPDEDVIIGLDDPWLSERGPGEGQGGQTKIGHPRPLTSPNPVEADADSLKGSMDPQLHAQDVADAIAASGFGRIKEKVNRIEKQGDLTLIRTNTNVYGAREVVLATGAGPIGRPDSVGDGKEGTDEDNQNFKRIASLDEFENEKPGKAGRRVAVMGSNAGVTAVNRALQRGYKVDYWFQGRLDRGQADNEEKAFDDFGAFYPGSPNKEARDEFMGDANKSKRPHREYDTATATDTDVTIRFKDRLSPPSLTVDQFVFSIGPDEDQEGSPKQILGDEVKGKGEKIKALLQPIYAEKAVPTDDLVIVVGFQSADGLLKVIGAAAARVAKWVEHSNPPSGRIKDISNCVQEVRNIVQSLPPSIVSEEQLTSINSACRALNHALERDETGADPEKGLPQAPNFNVDSEAIIIDYFLSLGFSDARARKVAREIVEKRSQDRRNNIDHPNPHGISNEVVQDVLDNNSGL